MLIERLGNGQAALYETETFTRMMKGEVLDSEEIRKYWAGPYEYTCLAPLGTPIDDPIWSAVRTTWLNNKIVRVQYQENMTYSNITDGWTL